MRRDEAIDRLRGIGADFHRRGWSLGTSSNYSVVVQREPLRLVVTASGRDKSRLAKDDFVLVDGDGAPHPPEQPRSSAETLLHAVLARSPDVGAVLHTHSVWGTLLSDLHFGDGALRIQGYEMLKGLDGVVTHEHEERVPILENTQDIAALAGELGELLPAWREPRVHAFLIRKHGLYTWGPDLDAAERQVEILEFLMECEGRRAMLRDRFSPTTHPET